MHSRGHGDGDEGDTSISCDGRAATAGRSSAAAGTDELPRSADELPGAGSCRGEGLVSVSGEEKRRLVGCANDRCRLDK